MKTSLECDCLLKIKMRSHSHLEKALLSCMNSSLIKDDEVVLVKVGLG